MTAQMPFTRSRENDPRMTYRGKVCLTFDLVRTGLGIFTSAGWRPPQLVEVDARLPSGRPAILRFNSGERGMLFAAFVPAIHAVPQNAEGDATNEGRDDG